MFAPLCSNLKVAHLSGLPVAGAALLAASAASAGTLDASLSRIARDGGGQRVSAIVTTATPPSRRTLQLVRRLGGRIARRYSLIPGFEASVSASQLRDLAAIPGVRSVSADLALRKQDEFANSAILLDVARASEDLTGTGVGVAVIDSGISDHNDFGSGLLRSKVVARKSFLRGNQRIADRCGHGTHVAGLIAGRGTDSSLPGTIRTYTGVAPDARLIDLRVLDQHGAGRVSDAIAAVEWAVANRERHNIRILNLSLGHPPGESYRTDPLCQAVERAWQSGILVVAAAGNRGRSNASDPSSPPRYGTINSPGNHPLVLTVGATKSGAELSRHDDEIASYSSRGPSRLDFILKPDVVAPGNRLVSTIAVHSTLLDYGKTTNIVPLSLYWPAALPGTRSSYFVLSGTSMATAVVSGAAALMLEKEPTLTPDTIKGRLMTTAVKEWNLLAGADIYSRGAGLVDIVAALRCGDIVTGLALSPRLERTATGIEIVHDQDLWGENIIWSDRALWGRQALWSDQALWNDQALWSDQALWTEQSVTGDVTSVALRGE
jgi:serine protease AprX